MSDRAFNPDTMGGAFPFDKEMQFRAWYVPTAMKLGISPNPDDQEHYYDYRALYDSMVEGGGGRAPSKPGGHFPSTFKTKGHPRAYLNDPGTGKVFDTRSAKYLTGEDVPDKALYDSESSPDLPGFDPERAKLINLLYAAPK